MFSPSEGGFGGFEPLTDCDLASIETEVESLNREVFEQISMEDTLKIALQLCGDSTVVVVMHNSRSAGEIIAPEVERLPEYIVRGTDYTATVVSKDEGRLRVLIRAVA